MGTDPHDVQVRKAFANRNAAPIKLLRLQSEMPQRSTTISEPYYLAVSEITCEQFARYACLSGAITDAEQDGYGIRTGHRGNELREPGMSWRSLSDSPDHPVGYISWNDAMAFCEFISQKSPGEFYLPSEAEWEFACRAGTTSRFHFGDKASSASLALGTSNQSGNKRFPPNAFGLYDMHGLVSELCRDKFSIGNANIDQDLNFVIEDGRVGDEALNHYRVVRGGSIGETANQARSAARTPVLPHMRHAYQGLRVAASIDTVRDASTNRPAIAARSK